MLKSIIEHALKHFLTDNRYHTLSQTQIEAYADLLALAMVIDHHIAQQERDLLTKILEQFEWPANRPSEHFINQSVRRAWGLLEAAQKNAAILSYCKDISTRLKEDWIRENAFSSVIKIVHADDKLDVEESTLINLLAEAFDLPDDQKELLITRARMPEKPTP